MAAPQALSTSTCDVLIVGFGPVGAVAACLLGQGGISTIVVDRLEGIYDRPRAVALDHEIARILQSFGLADVLARVTAPFSASEYFGVDGQLIKRLDMLPPPFPMSWTPSMVFMQPALEAALRARAGELASVEIGVGIELTGFEQHADHVCAELQLPDGTAQTVRARYLLACDGASSSVRQRLGGTLDDLDFDQPWVVVDVLANARGLAKLPPVSAQFCTPSRPTSYIVCTGAHRRWEIMLHPGEDPAKMEQPDEVWRLLSRWITPEDGTMWRAASYRFHALVASRWRDRRVLIAGDAAHQQPPFLGQGLCQGVRDAANIAWKLQRVVTGASAPDLLDTYQTERAAHVAQLIGTIKGIGAIVSERDVARARARDAKLLAEAGGQVRSQPRQDLMPALKEGCLGTSGAARGTLLPQPMVHTAAGPRRLDDVAGGGLRLVLSAGTADPRPSARARVERLGGRLIRMAEADGDMVSETDGILSAWFRRHAATAAIVRPDHYVFATAASTAELDQAIGELEHALA